MDAKLFLPLLLLATLSCSAAYRETVDLAGEWEFADGSRTVTKADGGAGAKVSVVQSELPPAANAVWKKVLLPGVQPFVPETVVRHYRRTFELPEVGPDKVVKLVFDKAFYRIRVKVNGTEVGDAEPWGLAWECDATKAVKPGRNELEVLISNELEVNGPRKSMVQVNWAVASYFGIRRGVRAEIRPKLHVTDVRAVTKVFPRPKLAATVSFSDGTSKMYEKECPDVKLWTPDTPNLYTFTLKDLGCDFPDDFSVRVGFRELDWSGRRFMMNGHPFIHRRLTTGPGAKNDDPEAVRRHIRLLKSRGIVGSRVFLPEDVELFARIADEEGFLVATCAPVGSCAEHKTDEFWERVLPDYMREQIRQQGNHPSIICWGLGNEFGAPYAGKDATCPKQAAVGAKVQAMDPTRPWCYYGEIEKGNPVRGPGPQPIRSVHYPCVAAGNGAWMPWASQWAAVHGASWHGKWAQDKPFVISEDLYHGLQDSPLGMELWGGDSIFTMDGFYHTCWQAYHWFASGYYRAGVSGWEPWSTFVELENQPMYVNDGPAMPDYLFAPRTFERTFFAGERVTFDFDLFNETFTPFEGEVTFTTLADGQATKTWKKSVTVPQGEGIPVTLELDAPKGTKPVRWTLVADIPGKLHETLEFYAFPRVKVDLPANVVTNALSLKEGVALAKRVAAGERILLLDVPQKGWAPLEIVRQPKANFLFKRDRRHLKDFPEGALSCWRPSDTNRTHLVESAYVKPSGTDAETWLDCADRDGLVYASVLRLPAGKGFWIFCQIPLLDRLETEPAAGWMLKCLLDELKGEMKFPTKGIAAPDKGVELLSNLGIATAKDGKVVFANAVTPTIARAVRDGGKTLWLSEPTAAFPVDWPVELVAQTNKEWILVRNGYAPGPDAPFVALKRPIPGLASDDFLWNRTFDFFSYFHRMVARERSNSIWYKEFPLTGDLRVKPGAKDVQLYTEPSNAMAAFRWGRGRVFVSTLKLSANFTANAQKVERVVRRILNYLGARTSAADAVLPQTWHPVGMQSWELNARLYGGEAGGTNVWFGTGDDMRYFPVNQCGWSLQANNRCPVEPWPTGTVRLDGVPFKFFNPGSDYRRANIRVIPPGAKVKLGAELWSRNAPVKRVWFLGACERTPTKGELEVTVPFTTGPNARDWVKQSFAHGRHFGSYASVLMPTDGGRIAWQGATKDRRTAALYLWHFDAPEKHSLHGSGAVTFENKMDVPMAIVAITMEN